MRNLLNTQKRKILAWNVAAILMALALIAGTLYVVANISSSHI